MDPSLLVSPGETHPVLSLGLGFPVQERHDLTGESPVKGHGDD